MNTDYDDVLRQALHAAAESIEPSADGLERIRARIGPAHVLSLATAAAWCSGIVIRLASWADPVISAAADFFWTAVDRFRPGEGPEHARVRYGWLRPVAAMGVAIFVVAAGAFAVMTVPQAISSSGSIYLPWQSHDGASQKAGNSGLAGTGSLLPTGPSTSGVPVGVLPVNPTPTSSCHPSGGTGVPTTSPPITTPPITTPPITTPPITTTPPTTSPTDTPTTPSTGTTTPDPGSAGTQNPAPQADGSGAQGDAVDQDAYVVPSKSQAPSPCASGTPATSSPPTVTTTGPSA